MHSSARLRSSVSGGGFSPTRWTLVLRAERGAADAGEALRELCAAYYIPVVRFLQRTLHQEDAAHDAAHEFFAALLQRGGFCGADPARGRFRSYLLGALKNFMLDRANHARRVKRGGGVIHELLDPAHEAPADLAASVLRSEGDARFDRDWAVEAMNRAMAQLEAEQAPARLCQFTALRPCLTGETAFRLGATAALLGLTEGALKVAAHRLRRRFRELLKAEIRQTIASGDDLQDELRHLCAALSDSV